MKIIKSFVAAFSLYSKLPMPHINWGSEDMKYSVCFFPFVGAVIGLAEWGFIELARVLSLGGIIIVTLQIVIPLLITGGFHVDGFMDTMDALHSYQDREKKLEIMKDPHIGAFSVISLIIYLLVTAGFLSEVKDERAFYALGFSFALSRCLSGLGIVNMKMAKDKGMLKTEQESSGKRGCNIVLTIEAVLIAAGCIITCHEYAVAIIIAQAVAFIYYVNMSKKQFGGITGDLAGFFVVITELLCVIFVSILGMILKVI